MNDPTDPFAALKPSTADTTKRLTGNIYLPAKVYEALPAAYMAVGTAFIVGAVYIGIGHWPMVGYLAVGVSCIFAGVTVSNIRRRERSG